MGDERATCRLVPVKGVQMDRPSDIRLPSEEEEEEEEEPVETTPREDDGSDGGLSPVVVAGILRTASVRRLVESLTPSYSRSRSFTGGPTARNATTLTPVDDEDLLEAEERSRSASVEEAGIVTASRSAAVVEAGLVEEIIVVGPAPFDVSTVLPSEPRTLRRTVEVLERLPRSREEEELPTRVEWFCFPEGDCELLFRKRQPQPRAHVYALFANDGRPLRGVALTIYVAASDEQPRLWVPVVLCVLTALPIVPALVAWLEQAAEVLRSGEAGMLLASALQLAEEVPRPVAGVLSVMVPGPYKRQLIHFKEHDAAGRLRPLALNALRSRHCRAQVCRSSRCFLPRVTGGGAVLGLAASLLGADGLATALAAVLLEKSLVIHSATVSLLAAAAESLVGLIYPFDWVHLYLPVMPKPLLELLDAPAPFILGVKTAWLTPEVAIAPGAIIIDLDLGTITESSSAPLPELPDSFLKDFAQAVHDVQVASSKTLEDLCDKNMSSSLIVAAESAVQLVCARHICPLTIFDLPFDKPKFLNRQPNQNRPFVDHLMDTQHFAQLLDQDLDLTMIAGHDDIEVGTQEEFKEYFHCKMPPPLGSPPEKKTKAKRTKERPAPIQEEEAAVWWRHTPLLACSSKETRTFDYGTLADLLGVNVDHLWTKLNNIPELPTNNASPQEEDGNPLISPDSESGGTGDAPPPPPRKKLDF